MQQSVKQQVSQALLRKTINNRLNNSFDEDYEFSDDRNKRIMHWDDNKRHYNSGNLLQTSFSLDGLKLPISRQEKRI